MKKSRFTDQQIVFALQQAESGTPVEEVCRKMGISQATFFRWKKVYGGLMPSEVRKLWTLEEENRRLCKLVADLTLDKETLTEVIKKRSDGRAEAHHGRHAARSRCTYRRYDADVREALTVLWEASDRICSKRLKPLVPVLLPALERHGQPERFWLLGTRTHKRGDRRRRRTKGGSRAVVGMAANPYGAHQADAHRSAEEGRLSMQGVPT